MDDNVTTFTLFKDQESIFVRVLEGWQPPSGLYGWRPKYRSIQYTRADLSQAALETKLVKAAEKAYEKCRAKGQYELAQSCRDAILCIAGGKDG